MLKTLIMIFISQFSLSFVYACAWPLGSNKSYLGINYSISEYNSIFKNRTQVNFSPEKITNESWDLSYYTGLNESDTLILTTKYSNIGAFEPVPGPAVSQVSDTYLGFKKTYKLGKISAAWELGYLITGDYQSDRITSPGYGESELNFAWHWAKILTSSDFYSVSARYRKRANAAPNAVQLNFEYGKKLDNKHNARFLIFYDEQLSGVNLFDPSSGWINFSFHRKDESQLIGGVGFSRKLNSTWNLNFLIAHKFEGRNTDASDRSISIGIGASF